MAGKRTLKLCSPILGIAPGSNSGGEVADRELLVALADLGMEHELLLPKNRPYPPHKNFRVAYAPIQTMYPPYIFNWFAYHYLLNTYVERGFDAVRVHSPYFVGLAVARFKKKYPRVPIVANYHHLEESRLFDLINRKFIGSWDLITVVSEFTKREILERYPWVEEKNILVVPNGGAEYFKPIKKPITITNIPKEWNGKMKLLFFNGLKERKNPGFLLKVLESLTDSFVLLIAGRGPLRASLESEVADRKLEERVRFWGYVEEEEKERLFSWADVLLLPSLMEGFGMVPIEAAACGTPAIVSDRGALPEVVSDGVTGRVLPLERDIWQRELLRLLEEPELVRQWGESGIRFAEKFNWKKSAEGLLLALERMV